MLDGRTVVESQMMVFILFYYVVSAAAGPAVERAAVHCNGWRASTGRRRLRVDCVLGDLS